MQYKIKMILFFVTPPKVVKASNYVAVTVAVAGDIALNFANGSKALCLQVIEIFMSCTCLDTLDS